MKDTGLRKRAIRRKKRFVFVLGGMRSGKSSFALRLAGSLPGRRVYIATGEPLDPEMAERIRLHREARGPLWTTVEEPRRVVQSIGSLDGKGVILLDCLTLWISNLIRDGLDDDEIFSEAGSLGALCKGAASNIIAVSNEVGLSIVPENRLARRFSDLSGRVNQIMAEGADEVYLVTAGIPLRIK